MREYFATLNNVTHAYAGRDFVLLLRFSVLKLADV